MKRKKEGKKNVRLSLVALAHIYFCWLVLPGVQSFNRTEHSSRRTVRLGDGDGFLFRV